MKICCISDTHMGHNELKMPEADVLVHSGDFLGVSNEKELILFNFWLSNLNYEKIFVVPGNHDGEFEKNFHYAESLLSNAIVLCDKEYVHDGIKFYGSPWTRTFYDWWFMKDTPDLIPHWKNIPSDTDVLITHSPPHLILDRVNGKDKNAGCAELRQEVITRIKPKLHIFGHLHMDGGKYIEQDGITFCNASMNNDNYLIARDPMVFEI